MSESHENCPLKTVTVRNGGGVDVTFSRRDFDQRNYEKPSLDHVEKLIDEKCITKEDVKEMVRGEIIQFPKQGWKTLMLVLKDAAIIAAVIKVIIGS